MSASSASVTPAWYQEESCSGPTRPSRQAVSPWCPVAATGEAMAITRAIVRQSHQELKERCMGYMTAIAAVVGEVFHDLRVASNLSPAHRFTVHYFMTCINGQPMPLD
ncbi:hypothetical protein GCM10017767_05030 [Halomonas urumqiensis]|nr:hypothetical protein GCM10017767_05030 [Halomonas urumqiensis]